MAVTDRKPATTAQPALKTLAAACRHILRTRRPANRPATTSAKTPRKLLRSAALQALYLSALALPGMNAYADDDVNPVSGTTSNASSNSDAVTDEDIGYQYSHYQESTRSIYTNIQSATTNSASNLVTINQNITRIHNGYNPITADSEHGYGHFRLDDRIRFGFNFYQDTWSGATPLDTSPAAQAANAYRPQNIAGASPLAQAGQSLYMNAQHQLFYAAQSQQNTLTGQTLTKLAPASQLQQTLAYASPEIRNQADFKFGYDWDNAAVDAGAGVSIEHDYLSRFGNLGGRLDFNRKLTSINWGVSYTSSQTHAQQMNYVNYTLYPASSLSSEAFGPMQSVNYLNGERQDYGLNLGLTQVLSKNSLLTAGFGFTSSNGYQANPYKGVDIISMTPSATMAGYWMESGYNILAERRPGERAQFTWNGSYQHYLEALQATAKLDYSFFHDDWGINAHTFELEWRQALGGGWSFTPRGRYYSQTAADFFTPYLINPTPQQLKTGSYSSDQRLASYGALSAGATLGRDFARGLTFELGFEYYAHASDLTLDGKGSGSYMDFSYYVANANIRADLGKLAQVGSGAMDAMFGSGDHDMSDMGGMAHMQHGHSAPAGVMFAHMLDQAGDYMLGYRYMRQDLGNAYQQGSQGIGVDALNNQNLGCPTLKSGQLANLQRNCGMYATGMSMNMHMLNLMYAPTDWLNLMLMPQFINMTMDMTMTAGGMMDMGAYNWMRNWQSNGGFGDTGGYAMIKLWRGGEQQLFMSQGITAPTGTINTTNQQGHTSDNLYAYDMQLGSGTWDYNPSLTYTGAAAQLFWGTQLTGTLRMQQQNARNYRLGDILQGTAWGGYQWSQWLSSTLRGVYTQQGAIKDYDYANNYQKMTGGSGNTMLSMPDISPSNYGGAFVDVGIGVTLNIPKGRYAGNSLSFEWLQPVYTDYNGYQLERTGALAASWGYMF